MLFRSGGVSSAVEQLAFNQLVDGSNPSRPTTIVIDIDSEEIPSLQGLLVSYGIIRILHDTDMTPI